MLLFVLRGRNKVSKEMQIFLLVLTGTPCSWSGSSVFKSVLLTLRAEFSSLGNSGVGEICLLSAAFFLLPFVPGC